MQRLADYFLVVGYDHDEEQGGRLCSKIIRCFPDEGWPDCPFNPLITHFCQLEGRILTAKHKLLTFFLISILTDLNGLSIVSHFLRATRLEIKIKLSL